MKKHIRSIYEKIWCLFAVLYWVQFYEDYPYSKAFDKWCRESLDKGCKFTNISEYSAEFNGKKLWIANHPCASFHLYEESSPNLSPSRYTKKLMQERLDSSWEI